MFQIKEAKSKSYPLQLSVPPTQEEFNNSIASSFENSVVSTQDQFKQKKELKKFMTLYKKSALCSSNRKVQLRENRFEHEYEDNYDDYTSLNIPDEELQDTKTDDNKTSLEDSSRHTVLKK